MTLRKDISSFLHFLRWFSAFVVVLSHMRNHLFIPYEQLEVKTIIAKVFYFVTVFGHEAVLVFFILSGYFVGGGDLAKIKN